MIAKRLETLIANEMRDTDIARRNEAEMVQRFQKLRDFGVLPKSRGKNADDLSSLEIVSAILSIITVKPGFAGVAAKTLIKLCPVGGPNASFGKADSFGMALATLFEDSNALESLVEVRVSDSEIYTNCHGRGVIIYHDGNREKESYYVGETAISLLQPGAEKKYDPRDRNSCMITETVFLPRFFEKIKRELQREKMYQVSP